jgi:hypothetical protein
MSTKGVSGGPCPGMDGRLAPPPPPPLVWDKLCLWVKLTKIYQYFLYFQSAQSREDSSSDHVFGPRTTTVGVPKTKGRTERSEDTAALTHLYCS